MSVWNSLTGSVVGGVVVSFACIYIALQGQTEFGPQWVRTLLAVVAFSMLAFGVASVVWHLRHRARARVRS